MRIVNDKPASPYRKAVVIRLRGLEAEILEKRYPFAHKRMKALDEASNRAAREASPEFNRLAAKFYAARDFERVLWEAVQDARRAN